MAKKKKQKGFSAVAAVKEMARERIGAPPISRVVPNKKKRQKSDEKYAPNVAKLLEDS